MRLLPVMLVFLVTAAAGFANFPGVVTAKSGLVLRDAPAASGRQLSLLPWLAGCTVLDPGGKEETIGGTKARWWRISAGGKTGWAFGAFLAPALLTEQWLTRTSWFWDGGNGLQLNFKSGGAVDIQEAWDGGETLKGNWQLAGGKLTVQVTSGKWSDMGDGFRGFTTLSGTLVALPDSLAGIIALSLGDAAGRAFVFRDAYIPVLAGAVRMHEGRLVVVLGSKAFITTDNAMFRKGPAVTAAAIPTRIKSGDPERPFLPTGTIVTANWRTEQKFTIGGRTGYWYRVTVNVDRELAPNESGWLFGAFLKEQQ